VWVVARLLIVRYLVETEMSVEKEGVEPRVKYGGPYDIAPFRNGLDGVASSITGFIIRGTTAGGPAAGGLLAMARE
jgi:hypothetical protein